MIQPRLSPARSLRPLPALVALALLAFAVRIYQIDHYSFWIDEALTPLRVQQNVVDIIAGRTFLQDAVGQDTHPPLYYLLIAATRRLFGDSDFAYRFPSLLFGVLLVPLLYQLGRRLFNRHPAGLAAALIAALNPLQVWYAQEARMYTMLVFLGALSSFVLWRAVEDLKISPQRAPRTQRKMQEKGFSFFPSALFAVIPSSLFTLNPVLRWLALYAVTAALLLYTHYTAVFLLAGHALIWSWLLWTLGYRRLILAGAAVTFLAALTIAPFTIPRLFTGPESGYTYLPPQVLLRDLVGGFAMGVTAPADPVGALLWWGFALLLAGGLWAAWRAPNGRFRVTFLLFYLLLTVAGLALGSLVKPMYQGVRHIMLGSPAFYLLLAGLVTWPIARPLPRLARAAALLVILWGSLAALANLYTNPEVAKDDLRALVAFVEEQAGRQDTVIYNDPILMLAHLHYGTRDDLPVTALPVYPHPVRPQTTEALAALNQEPVRLWYIPAPPTDGRDRQRFVTGWIRENLILLDDVNFSSRSTDLKVELYATRAYADAERDESAAPPLDLRWEGLPALERVTLAEQNEDELWLDLAWTGELAAGDRRLLFALEGVDGWIWTEENHPFWRADASWPAGESRRLPYRLALPAELPPGPYRLWLQGWDGDAGRPLGERIVVAEVELPPRPFSPPAAAGIRFENGLSLRQVDPLGTVVRPGHRVPLLTQWYSPAPLVGEITYELQLFQEQNGRDVLIGEQRGRPGAGWLTSWPAGSLVGGHPTVLVPEDAPGGPVELRWRLLVDGLPQTGRSGLWPFPREWHPLGGFEIEAWPFLAELPAVEEPLDARFGETIALRGYDLALDESGEQLAVTLVWQALEAPSRNFLVFVHLVDPASGEIVRQRDAVPVGGQRLTRGWRPGEVILDPYTLDLSGLPPGRYRLNVGLAEADTFLRPPVLLDGLPQPDGQLFLQEIDRR